MIEDESSKYKTFFDIGINDNDNSKKKFAVLRYTINCYKRKKRLIYNELIKRYISNEKLEQEELIKIKKILDGSIYEERRKKYSHCILCTDHFKINYFERFSSKFKYWDIGEPTIPYSPYGLMIYLKEKNKLQLEDIQDLPNEYLEELLQIEKELYDKLYPISEKKLVGINILFNQLSKSELCIHGHVEFMIKDIDKDGVGAEYVLERPFDKFTEIINSKMINAKEILKIPEGIKMDFDNLSLNEIKDYVAKYENIIKYYFERAKGLKSKKIKILSEEDLYLYKHGMLSAMNFVYVTYYKEKFILSNVPQLTLDFVPFDEIKDTQFDLYNLSINRYYDSRNNLFMRNISPTVRPSTKICEPMIKNDRILETNKKIYNMLEKLY